MLGVARLLIDGREKKTIKKRMTRNHISVANSTRRKNAAIEKRKATKLKIKMINILKTLKNVFLFANKLYIIIMLLISCFYFFFLSSRCATPEKLLRVI